MTTPSFRDFRRITIKVGSSLLVDSAQGKLKREWLTALCADIAELHKQGADVIVVSSGAIALGRSVLKLPKGTLKLEESQGAAAVGQIALAKSWADALGDHGITTGQILLTLWDTEERRNYLNARETLARLLEWRAIPVVNENDTVIGIAASGTTPYVIGALRNARANGILTASVSCNPDSPIAQEAEIKIEAIVGPEFVTGSTRLKSGTAQKLILNMITTITMIKLGRVKGNKMVNMQLSNAKLVDRGARMIVEELGIDYEHAKNILLIQGSVKKAVDAFKLQQNK